MNYQFSAEEKQYGKSKSVQKKTQCTQCGHIIEDNESFCPDCGKPYHAEEKNLCPYCKSPYYPSENYCAECGKSLKTQEDATKTAQVKSEKELQRETLIADKKRREETELRIQKQKTTNANPDIIENNEELISRMTANLSKISKMENDKAEKIDEQNRLIAELERARVAEENRKTQEIYSLTEENRKTEAALNLSKEENARKDKEIQKKESEIQALRKKNLLIIQANSDLQHQYDSIMAEKTRLESLGNRLKWKCNYCGNLHDSPSECSRPDLDGVWINA